MDEKELFDQILSDMRQNSAGNSAVQAELQSRVTELENELSAWTRESFKDDARIRDLRLRVAELERALRTIATPKRADGTYNLSREACEQLAKTALAQGGPSEES